MCYLSFIGCGLVAAVLWICAVLGIEAGTRPRAPNRSALMLALAALALPFIASASYVWLTAAKSYVYIQDSYSVGDGIYALGAPLTLVVLGYGYLGPSFRAGDHWWAIPLANVLFVVQWIIWGQLIAHFLTPRKTPEREPGAMGGPAGTGSASAVRQGNRVILVTLIIVIVVVIVVSEIAVLTLNVVPPWDQP